MPSEPERFDAFMARANAAYYANQDPFADFTTSPEITQVFGEVLGGWARIVWQMMGSPADLILAEAGPGRGTLMKDALRVFGPANVHFIETSPRLRAEQACRIPAATWHDSLETLPEAPLILLANEFLDALPIRQFIRRADGWKERYVADGAYSEHSIIPAKAGILFPPNAPEGTIQEINQPALAFVKALARRRAVALFIDYGHTSGATGESVQAISAGQYANPLAEPGTADITAHVDFAALATAARDAGAAVHGPIKQNAFLTALGFFQRTDRLAQKNPSMAENLRLAAQRLTAPEAMGSLFKVFAISPPGMAALPGFEP
jgi:SAM-dependent MidA family methyltransferase